MTLLISFLFWFFTGEFLKYAYFISPISMGAFILYSIEVRNKKEEDSDEEDH